MSRSALTISLADLSAAGIRLRPDEAVTLAHQLTLQVIRGDVAGVPSPHVIRLSASGAVSVEGPVAADGRSVGHAAQLLEALLPPAGPETSTVRLPGGLKLLLARAQRTLDLPPFPSLDAFAESLARFAATDAAAAIGDLVARWIEATAPKQTEPAPGDPPASIVEPFGVPADEAARQVESGGLTISDVRRARRATGMRLAQVAERSQIPLGLLRQLEWGYLHNWPPGREGERHLARYARTTGLDEQIVLATVAPLIAELEPRPAHLIRMPARTGALAELPAAADPVGETAIVHAMPVEPSGRTARTRRGRTGLAAAAALLLAALPLWWSGALDRSATPGGAAVTTTSGSEAGADTTLPSPEPAAPAAVEPAESVQANAAAEVAEPANQLEAPLSAPARARQQDASVASGDMTPAYRLASDGVAYSPSFASVGSAMFFHGDPKQGPTPLMRAETGTSGEVLRITRVIDDHARNFHARPSPDARLIAFDSDRDGERGVYVADADGQNVRRVSPPGFSAVPSWSPDGGTLAFVRAEPDRPQVWNLWTVELATGELRQITRFRYGQPWGGSWFPDGRRIAYSHETRLIERDLDSGRERVFESPHKGRLARTPAVSPDGQRIVFQVAGDGVWLLELADGSMRRILDDPTAEEFTWSPDGRRVAFHSRRVDGWSVWIMAPR